MNTIKQIQQWYLSRCNGDWEYTYGVHVETLDNPGWHVSVDLIDTDLGGKQFFPVEYGIGPNSVPEDTNWISCKVEGDIFHGYGGPEKLEEIFSCFLAWARSMSKQTDGEGLGSADAAPNPSS